MNITLFNLRYLQKYKNIHQMNNRNDILCPHALFLLDHHIMVIDVPSSPCYEYVIIDYITDKYRVLGVLKHQLVVISYHY